MGHRTHALAALALSLAPLASLGAGAPPAAEHGATAAAERGAWVRLRDTRVLEISAALGDTPPERRAREASQALAAAFDADPEGAVRTEVRGESAAVYLGAAPVLQLGPADAAAAGAASVPDAAAAAATRIQAAVDRERRRTAAQEAVFSFSMLVFTGLLAFLLARKLGALALALAARAEAGGERFRPLAFGGMELASAATVRGASAVALRLGRWAVHLAVLYVWVLFALSLFRTTRGYGDRLSDAVLAPLAGLIGRLGRALPLLVVAAVAAVLVALALRGVRLFFESVASGETELGWLPAELARPTSALVRGGLLVVVLLLAPVLGLGEGGAIDALARSALLAAAIGGAPLAACVVAGLPVVYGRTLRRGDLAEVGGRRGRVAEVTLLSVHLEDEHGARVTVPHVLALFHPTRVERRGPEGGR
jgi:small-conductance mechanosensitive channel